MRRLVTVAAVACVLIGCGGDNKKLNAVGRVVKGGSAFTVPPDDFVKVVFVPYTEPGEQPRMSYICDYDNTAGTFKALGPDLKGIPPGKYRVAVTHERNKKDLFKGAFDLPKTPFVVEVETTNKEIVIDLDKK
jgi:hypothetical protein